VFFGNALSRLLAGGGGGGVVFWSVVEDHRGDTSPVSGEERRAIGEVVEAHRCKPGTRADRGILVGSGLKILGLQPLLVPED